MKNSSSVLRRQWMKICTKCNCEFKVWYKINLKTLIALIEKNDIGSVGSTCYKHIKWHLLSLYAVISICYSGRLKTEKIFFS